MLSDAMGGELSEREEKPKRFRPKRADDPALAELTDPEFVEKLRECHEDRRWPIGHMVELERRGLHILDEEPVLMEVASEKIQSFKEARERIRGMADGSLDRITAAAGLEQIRERAIEALRSFPKINFPDLPNPLVTRASPEPLSAVRSLGIPTSPPAPTLEMQVAQLEALSEIREEIRESRRRGWSFWLMVALTAIAALAAVTSVVLAVS